jgi:2'-5' RNA ligase
LHRRPATGEPIRCQQRFLSALELEDHLKGWAGQLDRQRFHVTACHLGAIPDEQTEAAATLCDRFIHRTALP